MLDVQRARIPVVAVSLGADYSDALLECERLSHDEMQQLEQQRVATMLWEVIEARGLCRRLTALARARLAESKKLILRTKESSVLAEAKCSKIDAETELQDLRDRVASLRDVGSILQTLVRPV